MCIWYGWRFGSGEGFGSNSTGAPTRGKLHSALPIATMPRKRSRQQVVLCDVLDCVDRPGPSLSTAAELSAAEAVARQLPPPKALVLYGSGFMRQLNRFATNLDVCSFPHLDRIVQDGCLGTLAIEKPVNGVCM